MDKKVLTNSAKILANSRITFNGLDIENEPSIRHEVGGHDADLAEKLVLLGKLFTDVKRYVKDRLEK